MGGLSFSRLTWDTAERLFLLRCKSQNLAKPTLDLYTTRLDLFVKWATETGASKPAKMRPEDLRAFIESCRARGNKASTVEQVLRILRTFWGFLKRDGLVLVDPMEKIERPKREKKLVRPISEGELRKVLEKIDTRRAFGPRDYSLILFLADSGARISEALSLKMVYVDWVAQTATLHDKGGKERRVGFGRRVREAVLSWLRRRGGGEDVAGPVWVDRFGLPLKRHHFEHRFKALTVLAGISAARRNCHALRHYFALTFLRNGGDPLSLQRLLGHEDLTMTRHYCAQTDDDVLAKHRQASPLDRLAPLPGEHRRVRIK
jgi:site-specific recombinase XerD